MDPVRCPYGVIRDPYDPAQDPLGSQLTPEFAKIPHGRHVWSYGACTGPLWYPHGLFTGCLRFLNPYGTRKLLIHALKLYGSHTGGKIRTASHGPRTAMWVDVRFLFKTAREQPVRGPRFWCDWIITLLWRAQWPQSVIVMIDMTNRSVEL